MATVARVFQTVTAADLADGALPAPLELQLQQYYRAALAWTPDGAAAAAAAPVSVLSDQLEGDVSLVVLTAELGLLKEAVSSPSSQRARAADALALLERKVRARRSSCRHQGRAAYIGSWVADPHGRTADGARAMARGRWHNALKWAGRDPAPRTKRFGEEQADRVVSRPSTDAPTHRSQPDRSRLQMGLGADPLRSRSAARRVLLVAIKAELTADGPSGSLPELTDQLVASVEAQVQAESRGGGRTAALGRRTIAHHPRSMGHLCAGAGYRSTRPRPRRWNPAP